MTNRNAFVALFAAGLALLVLVQVAWADKVVSEVGSGPEQTLNPNGLAVDFETGRLYVADTANNRIQVFDKEEDFVKSFGSKGSGDGQFEGPRGITVDNAATSPSRHDLYVVDSGNNRIQKFGPEGEFKCAFGSVGEAEGQLSSVGPVLVGVGPGGTVYVVDSLVSGDKYKHRLQKFDSSCAPIAPQKILVDEANLPAHALAVDSSGDFYVSMKLKAVQKYDEDGDEVGEIEEVFEEGAEMSVVALAVDDEDHLLAASSELGARVSVMELDAAGNRLRRFGYGALFPWLATAVAPDLFGPSGPGVYLSEGFNGPTEGNRVLQVDFPPAGPLVLPEPCSANPLGPSKATLNAEVNPEGKATTFHFEYVTQAQFEAEGFSDPQKTPETPLSGPADFKRHKASAEVDVVPETKYHCRAVATNADAPPGGNAGPEGEFIPPQAPEIEALWSSGVNAEGATLNAAVNPLGIGGTTGFFEYVDDAAFQLSEFATAKKAPLGEPLDFGGANAPEIRGTTITGLEPRTTYHYRLIATDELIAPNEVTSDPDTFLTYGAGQGPLPDNRGYEMVSPDQKNSAEVGVPSFAGGLFNQERSVRIQAAATSGEAVTYTSWTSFGDAESAPSASQYLSKRSPTGWGTENISPYGFIAQVLEPPFRGFTPDLRFGGFVTTEPPLTPEAQVDTQNLYLRDNETGAIQALTIEAPEVEAGEAFCVNYAGASADGTQAIFAARGAMTGAGALVGKGFSLYEWSAAKGLSLVSVLPNGTPAPPVKSAFENVGVGTGFGGVGGNCTTAQAPTRHAISADGSVIFWSYGGTYEGSERPLFARIEGTETIQLDAVTTGVGSAAVPGKGKFWAATADGSKVFFTAPGRLVAGAKDNGLYRYDTTTDTLSALTPKADPGIVTSGGIVTGGVIGVSEDGNYAYFVGKGALTGEEKNEAGQEAQEGANNLYLYHEGEGVRFIARLAVQDEKAWETAPERLTARVTPDGRHLAFLSVEAEALSNFDNTIAPPGTHCQPGLENELIGNPRCPEAYLYDADADSLTCASCNPALSRPTGPAELPAWTNPYQGPRYLPDDGSRFFFESRDALSSTDENKRRDVYEFEVKGAGSCNEGSPDFVVASEGCLSLISSGQSEEGEDESYLLDASASGRDVFISTRSVLTGWDINENYDVYDAREGGGFPEPASPPVPCDPETTCLLPPSPPPGAPAPATPSFQGPGNPKPKKQKKNKNKAKKKNGKKKHKGNGKKQHKRAGQSRGAGR